MMSSISSNTKAILLLTAPLTIGRDTSTIDILTHGEYKRLARCLFEIQREPADLLSSDASELFKACKNVIDESRINRLLNRGFQLSQAIERWQSRNIWVISRADADYPNRLRSRLREDSPAVIYGVGNSGLLETGGLAVVGSRHIDNALAEHAIAIGRLSAHAGRTIVSGGARGIDQSAMRGALESGGKVIGVLGDSLEKTSMKRDHRNLILNGRLLLITPYDPSAGFNVGNAMQRNKLIYALADAALVMSSDLKKGGTWAGATEQLDKFRIIPVYVRFSAEHSPGIDALHKRGATPWPNPETVDEFESLFTAASHETKSADNSMGLLFSNIGQTELKSTYPGTNKIQSLPHKVQEPSPQIMQESIVSVVTNKREKRPYADSKTEPSEFNPAKQLFSIVQEIIEQLLKTSMSEADIADTLDITKAQAHAWLKRLLEEDRIEKINKPVRYRLKQPGLFQK